MNESKKWSLPAVLLLSLVSLLSTGAFGEVSTNESQWMRTCPKNYAGVDWIKRYKVTGVAKRVSDQQTLYTEHLSFIPGDQKRGVGGVLNVDYRFPDGRPLAEKTVVYHCHITDPDFYLRDLTNGRDEGVRWQDNEIVSYHQDESKALEPPQGELIIDAGFDHFIKKHWKTLTDGDVVMVNYLFPRDNVFIKLRVKKSPAPKIFPQDEQQEIKGITFFKISANNLLFRLFSSPISVGYDAEQSLKYFIGPSNLPMMKDEKQVVIRYSD